MIRALFLDAHDTLFREQPARAAIYAEVAARHGIRCSEPAVAAAMRRAHRSLPREIDGAFRYSPDWFRHFMDAVFAEFVGPAPRSSRPLQEELLARFADPATFVPFPDAVPALERLRTRVEVLGVVSNGSPALPRLLDQLGLARWFDFVLASASERCEKPDRELFVRALRRAGVRADEALHVGDHPENDLAGARRAGLNARLLLRGAATEGGPKLQGRESGLASLLALADEF
jgi:putative hydrolase of the HAD superfamily